MHNKVWDVNIIKTFDRIILLLAVIMIVPVFVLGVAFISGSFKSVTPEYIEWQKKVEYRINQLRDEGIVNSDTFYHDRQYNDLLNNRPEKYRDIPLLLQIVGGILAVPVGFVFVLLIRCARRLSLWIIWRFKTTDTSSR